MPRTSTNKNIPIKQNDKINPNLSTPITSPIVIKNNSLFGAIKEGFGFGIGSTIARNMFASTPITSLSSSKISCIEYNKCLESDDKYECFGSLDQKEYVECRTKN